ncbi:18832_t:CDS:2 [Gigaspora margarita]|uniref:18832_t:CDS:1 n=1 Tax=Gigaspora margarita TaxID=4874 RepID=A0ABM8W293_GIGMA|nr:18832_t:CDS:2 [Gigaspora margarita]
MTAGSGTIYIPPINNITKEFALWSAYPVSPELIDYLTIRNKSTKKYIYGIYGIGVIRHDINNLTDQYAYCNGNVTTKCSSSYSENFVPNQLWCLAIGNFWNESLRAHIDFSFALDVKNSTNIIDSIYDSPVSRRIDNIN